MNSFMGGGIRYANIPEFTRINLKFCHNWLICITGCSRSLVSSNKKSTKIYSNLLNFNLTFCEENYTNFDICLSVYQPCCMDNQYFN